MFSGEAIRCYQCSSDENKTIDDCGAYANFDSEKVHLVDCMSEDAVSPGKSTIIFLHDQSS